MYVDICRSFNSLGTYLANSKKSNSCLETLFLENESLKFLFCKLDKSETNLAQNNLDNRLSREKKTFDTIAEASFKKKGHNAVDLFQNL